MDTKRRRVSLAKPMFVRSLAYEANHRVIKHLEWSASSIKAKCLHVNLFYLTGHINLLWPNFNIVVIWGFVLNTAITYRLAVVFLLAKSDNTILNTVRLNIGLGFGL